MLKTNSKKVTQKIKYWIIKNSNFMEVERMFSYLIYKTIIKEIR